MASALRYHSATAKSQPILPSAFKKLTIGREKAPLLVIDNLVSEADSLVDLAATKIYGGVATYYPGIRAKVPLTYQQFVLDRFGCFSASILASAGAKLRFTACHFSSSPRRPRS